MGVALACAERRSPCAGAHKDGSAKRSADSSLLPEGEGAGGKIDMWRQLNASLSHWERVRVRGESWMQTGRAPSS